MKLNPTLFSGNARRSSVFIALLGLVVSFSSCKTDVQAPPNPGALAITNASPLRSSIDFYIGNQKVNTTALLYGQKIDYVNVNPGTYSGTVTNSGATKALYTGNFSITSGLYHSLYIVSQPDSTISYVTLRDTIPSPVTGKAAIRFINLVSDAGAYNLEISNDTTAFANKLYKGVTPFKSVTAQIVKLTLRDKATNAVISSQENVEFKNQKIYTIIAKGLVNTAVDAQKVSLLVSPQFVTQ
jgi:hypothetical protein